MKYRVTVEGNREPSTDRLSVITKTSFVRIVFGLLLEEGKTPTPSRNLDFHPH